MSKVACDAIHAALGFLPPKMAERYKKRMHYALSLCNVFLKETSVEDGQRGEYDDRSSRSIVFLQNGLKSAKVLFDLDRLDVTMESTLLSLLKKATASTTKYFERNVLLLLATVRCLDGKSMGMIPRSQLETLAKILALLALHFKFGVLSKTLLQSLKLTGPKGGLTQWNEVTADGHSVVILTDDLLKEFLNEPSGAFVSSWEMLMASNDDVEGGQGEREEEDEEEMPPPPKRKRGRPPKNANRAAPPPKRATVIMERETVTTKKATVPKKATVLKKDTVAKKRAQKIPAATAKRVYNRKASYVKRALKRKPSPKVANMEVEQSDPREVKYEREFRMEMDENENVDNPVLFNNAVRGNWAAEVPKEEDIDDEDEFITVV